MRTVTLNDELAALLERDKPLDEAMREAAVMDLFRCGKVSTGKARELLGLDLEAFLQRARDHNVPVFLTTEKEFEADMAALGAWHRQQQS